MDIGIAIKTVRQHFGWSQQELSERTGLTQATISHIENGLKTPSKSSIKKICDSFEIPEAILYVLGMESSDVPGSRAKMFEKLFPNIKDIAIQIIGDRKSKLLK